MYVLKNILFFEFELLFTEIETNNNICFTLYTQSDIKSFFEDCKLTAPPVFFQGPWALFSCTWIQVPSAC